MPCRVWQWSLFCCLAMIMQSTSNSEASGDASDHQSTSPFLDMDWGHMALPWCMGDWSHLSSNHETPRIMYSNARSLLPKIEELRVLVHSNQPDIDESWLSQNVLNDEISIAGYNCLRQRSQQAWLRCMCVYKSSSRHNESRAYINSKPPLTPVLGRIFALYIHWVTMIYILVRCSAYGASLSERSVCARFRQQTSQNKMVLWTTATFTCTNSANCACCTLCSS